MESPIDTLAFFRPLSEVDLLRKRKPGVSSRGATRDSPMDSPRERVRELVERQSALMGDRCVGPGLEPGHIEILMRRGGKERQTVDTPLDPEKASTAHMVRQLWVAEASLLGLGRGEVPGLWLGHSYRFVRWGTDLLRYCSCVQNLLKIATFCTHCITRPHSCLIEPPIAW